MTTVHARAIGEEMVLARAEFDRLVQLARRNDHVEVKVREEDVPTIGVMRLAETGGAFDWLADEPDLYSLSDLKVRYR